MADARREETAGADARSSRVVQHHGDAGPYRSLWPEGAPRTIKVLRARLVQTAPDVEGGDLWEIVEWEAATPAAPGVATRNPVAAEAARIDAEVQQRVARLTLPGSADLCRAQVQFDLVCVLSRGHDGEHRAFRFCLEPDPFGAQCLLAAWHDGAHRYLLDMARDKAMLDGYLESERIASRVDVAMQGLGITRAERNAVAEELAAPLSPRTTPVDRSFADRNPALSILAQTLARARAGSLDKIEALVEIIDQAQDLATEIALEVDAPAPAATLGVTIQGRPHEPACVIERASGGHVGPCATAAECAHRLVRAEGSIDRTGQRHVEIICMACRKSFGAAARIERRGDVTTITASPMIATAYWEHTLGPDHDRLWPHCAAHSALEP